MCKRRIKMMHTKRRRAFSTLCKVTFSFLMVLTFLAASLPQQAQAQANCRTIHIVREGDTKPFIAHTYDLRWREIADANDVNRADKVTVGQQLCIPEGDDDERPNRPAGDSDATYSLTISGGRIFISLSKFSQNYVYLVKARGANVGAGGWYNLGRIQVSRNQDFSTSFTVPNDLRDVQFISVCLKDQSTDELICRNAANP
jgi:hypothetical protein